MPSILCSVPGPRHHHTTSAEARACWAASRATPPPPPVVPFPPPQDRVDLYGHTSVIHKTSSPTQPQLDYIKKLGGNPTWAARNCNREQAAKYIDRLKSGAVQTPTPAPREKRVFELTNRQKMLVQLLDQVPDGRYAVQPDETVPLTFIRISRPKKGQYGGTIKVQTQHSDDLILRWVYWPSGRVSEYERSIEEKLLLVCVDSRRAATTYGRELGQCCCCGKTLTDERSRYYGIGPECEKKWPWIIQLVNERDGEYAGV